MIETIATSSEFENLKTEWNDLLETSNSNRFFLTWEWLHTWWKHLSGDRRLNLVTVRSGEQLLAIAPLARRASNPLHFWRRSMLEFLGVGTIGSDFLDLIVLRDKEDEILPCLNSYLAKTNSLLEFARINKQSSVASAFAESFKKRGWLVREAGEIVSPAISLSGHTWESYLGTLGAEHRYNFRRRLKALTKQFQFSFEPVRSEEERKQALTRLISLHNLRWQGRGHSDAFCTSELVAFHEELSSLALQRGWLRLFTMCLDGKPVASLYGFHYNRVFYFYQSGFDPSYSRFSVGLVAMGLAIKHTIEEGAEEFNLLCGAEGYKNHWAQNAYTLGKLELYPPGLAGMLSKSVREVTLTSKQLVRNVLPSWLVERIRTALTTRTGKVIDVALSREDRRLPDATYQRTE